MKYYLLLPEVAGGLGENTILSKETHPPIVSRLHYEFYGWLGDDLLETFPCFLVTIPLAEALKNAGVSGAEFREVEVTTSGEFEDFYPDFKLPPFLWLYVYSKGGHDDLGVAADGSLVVSEEVLRLLRTFKIEQCEISEYL
jgi:hypothetical protein